MFDVEKKRDINWEQNEINIQSNPSLPRKLYIFIHFLQKIFFFKLKTNLEVFFESKPAIFSLLLELSHSWLKANFVRIFVDWVFLYLCNSKHFISRNTCNSNLFSWNSLSTRGNEIWLYVDEMTLINRYETISRRNWMLCTCRVCRRSRRVDRRRATNSPRNTYFHLSGLVKQSPCEAQRSA